MRSSGSKIKPMVSLRKLEYARSGSIFELSMPGREGTVLNSQIEV